MSVSDVMKKALQLAKHQLGMPAAQAFCEHEWEILFAHRISLEPTERQCKKCNLRQRAETVWRDVKPNGPLLRSVG